MKRSPTRSRSTASTPLFNHQTLKRGVIVLWLGALLSAMAVVSVRHHNRLAFIAWQKVDAERVEFQSEHGRLLLEKATWTRRHNIVDAARKRLAMRAPASGKIIILKLQDQQ